MERWFWPLCLILSTARVALGIEQTLSAQWLPHDDSLFATHANHLLNGDWLGPYDSKTLAKPPGYPMILAAVASLGTPLITVQQVLYVMAGIVFTAAIRPAVPSPTARLAALSLYLFSPTSFMGEVYAVKRVGLYPAIVTFCLAALAGAVSRIPRSRLSTIGWGLLAGIALALAHAMRQESLWLLPATTLAFGVGILRTPTWKERGLRLGLVALTLVTPTQLYDHLLAQQNERIYGLYGVTELEDESTQRAHDALLRIPSDDERRPFVPLPRAARKRAYTEIPAFAELGPQIEKKAAWRTASCVALPQACGDIAGAWIWWAVRDAAEAAGHHENALEAKAFYERLANEADAACREGRLSCGDQRYSFALGAVGLDPWSVPPAVDEAVIAMASIEGGTLAPTPSTRLLPFVTWLLPMYERTTNHHLFYNRVDHRSRSRRPRVVDHLRRGLLTFYRAALPALLFVGVLGFVAALARDSFFRISDALAIEALLLGSVVTLATGLAILDRTAFPAMLPRYVAPGLPPLLLFTALSCTRVASSLRTWRRAS